MASVSVLPVLFFVLAAEGTVRSPKGVVYFPPYGFPGKTVTCSTDVSANITWIVIVNGKEISLDPIRFNITKVNATTSAMYLTSEFILSTFETKGLFLETTLFCRTETNETSNRFQFKKGALQIPSSGNPKSVTVSEGQDACFTCSWVANVDVLPDVSEVFWRRVGSAEVLNETMRAPSQSLTVSSKLCLPRVNRSLNAAEYRCELRNEFGSVNSSVAKLTVKYGIVVSGIPISPCFIVGKNVTVNVTVFGVQPRIEIHFDPDPAVVRMENISRTEGIHRVKYTFIAPKSRTANVMVSAKTALATDTLARPIYVYDRDGQVNVSGMPIRVNCSNVALAMQWTVLGNFINQSIAFILRWRRHAGGSMHQQSLLVPNNSSVTRRGGNHVLDGLDQKAQYSVEVEAVSECGSLFSENITALTEIPFDPSATAPDPPVLDFVSATNHGLTLNWTVEYNGGDDISNYTVIWSKDANFKEEHTMNLPVSENANLTQQGGIWTLENLAPGTAYYVKLRANNCLGYSTSSPRTVCTSCDPPAPSTPKYSQENLTAIKFDVKAPELVCGTMADYLVTDSGIRNLTVEYSTRGEYIAFTMTNLTRVGQYHIQVLQIGRLEDDSCSWTSRPSGVLNVLRRPEDFMVKPCDDTWLIILIVFGCAVDVAAGAAAIIVIWKAAKGTGGEQNKIKHENEDDNSPVGGEVDVDTDVDVDGDVDVEVLVQVIILHGSDQWQAIGIALDIKIVDIQKITRDKLQNREKLLALIERMKVVTPSSKWVQKLLTCCKNIPMPIIEKVEMELRKQETTGEPIKKPEVKDKTNQVGPAEEELHESEKSFETKKKEPVYMQPQFNREEDRPPQRAPARKVTYAQLDPKATRKPQEPETYSIPGMNLHVDDDDDDLESVPIVNTSLV